MNDYEMALRFWKQKNMQALYEINKSLAAGPVSQRPERRLSFYP